MEKSCQKPREARDRVEQKKKKKKPQIYGEELGGGGLEQTVPGLQGKQVPVFQRTRGNRNNTLIAYKIHIWF